jgi:dynein heavy chain, axonemal
MTEFDAVSKQMIFSKLADWWLTRAGYGEDLRCVGPKMVDAALQVYTESLRELLPTPTRSHYTFNLRDLSKVIRGMQTAGNTLKGPDDAVRLWVHEMMRVFSDRLIDEGDRDWLVETLKRAVEKHFRVTWCEPVQPGLACLLSCPAGCRLCLCSPATTAIT